MDPFVGFEKRGRYYKCLTSFLDILPMMKGARLSVWECVKCYEPAPLGANFALILKHTALSEPSAKRAIQFLLDHSLIHEERGDDGDVRYRGSAYAWSGPDEEEPAAPEERREAGTGPPPAKKIFFRVYDDDDSPGSDLSEQHHQHQIFAPETKKIFSGAGVDLGRNLDRLAETVLPELAARWVQRLPHAPQRFTEPVGFMVKHLLHDPTEEPPPSWKLPDWDKPRQLAREDFSDGQWERMEPHLRANVLAGYVWSDGYTR